MSSQHSEIDDFDVVVYGSTSAGVAAAIQSARLGNKIALISPHEHIGGIQVEGLGASDIDSQADFSNSCIVKGLALELHYRISSYYGRLDRLKHVISENVKEPDVWRFESRVAEKIILDWLNEYPTIEIIKTSLSPSDPIVRTGNRVEKVRLLNGRTISGKVFIEASYEGDFLAAASISTVYGRESCSTYGETLAGKRDDTTYTQLQVSVDPYNIPGDPSSGVIPGVSSELFGRPGDGDKHLAAFSFRLPITKVPHNRLPIYKPEGYDPKYFELHRRYVLAGGSFFLPKVRLPRGKTDLIGSESPLATDLVGMNDSWVTASPSERQQLLKDSAHWTQGFLYFLSHDESLPAEFRAHWSNFGYCLDEFPDNNHFPRMMYIRDGRRLVSDFVITQALTSKANSEPEVSDPVAVTFWPPDTHCATRVVRDGKVYNEGFVFNGEPWRPFGIPYRALVPKLAEARNVLAATCISSSHVAYGAIRIEHQFYTLGQVCANAADIALKSSVAVQDIPYTELKDRLLEQGVVIEAPVV